jgi:hypothetical protein
LLVNMKYTSMGVYNLTSKKLLSPRRATETTYFNKESSFSLHHWISSFN